jgi:ATP-dependent proteinase. Serine peptidase. MEROPS family S16
MESGKQIMLVAQKAAAKDEPKPDDLFDVGCLSSILQMLKLPDGTVKVLVEGAQRASALNIQGQRRLFRLRGCAYRIQFGNQRGIRSDAARGGGAVRPVCEAEQKNPA